MKSGNEGWRFHENSYKFNEEEILPSFIFQMKDCECVYFLSMYIAECFCNYMMIESSVELVYNYLIMKDHYSQDFINIVHELYKKMNIRSL